MLPQNKLFELVSSFHQAIWQPLYDCVYLDRGGHYEFFLHPIGMKPLPIKEHNDHVKTAEQTNMVLPGQLPADNSFYCMGIRVAFFPGKTAMYYWDSYQIRSNGVLRFHIQNRRYVEQAPLAAFPPMLDTMPCIKDNNKARAHYGYFEIVPTLIESNKYFGVDITLNSRIRLSAVGKLQVFLDGYLIRDAQ